MTRRNIPHGGHWHVLNLFLLLILCFLHCDYLIPVRPVVLYSRLEGTQADGNQSAKKIILKRGMAK